MTCIIIYMSFWYLTKKMLVLQKQILYTRLNFRFKRQILPCEMKSSVVQAWLHSVCAHGWPWTSSPSSLHLQSAGMTVVDHHAQLLWGWSSNPQPSGMLGKNSTDHCFLSPLVPNLWEAWLLALRVIVCFYLPCHFSSRRKDPSDAHCENGGRANVQ